MPQPATSEPAAPRPKVSLPKKPAAEATPAPAPAKKPLPAKAPAEALVKDGFASAPARNLAMEYGLTEKDIKGTGKNGKITKNDVMRADDLRRRKEESRLFVEEMSGAAKKPLSAVKLTVTDGETSIEVSADVMLERANTRISALEQLARCLS